MLKKKQPKNPPWPLETKRLLITHILNTLKVSFKTDEGQGDQGRVTSAAWCASGTALLEVAPLQKQVPQHMDYNSSAHGLGGG